MFTVRNKSHPEWTYVVYAVERLENGNTRFLMWNDGWKWFYADAFEPVDDL